MPKQKQIEMDPTVLEDVSKQVDYFDFNISDKSRKNDAKGQVVRFDTWLYKRPAAFPASPTVVLRDAGISLVGEREKKLRGINVYRGKGFVISTLGLIIPNDNDQMRTLVHGVLRRLREKYDPTRKSIQYQRWFKPLEDGTKVYQATKIFDDTDGTITNQITDPDAPYDVPESSYGQFLFSDESPWYVSARMPLGTAESPSLYRVYLFDAKGSQMSGKGASEGVYQRGGIPFTDLDALERLMASDFFMKRRWKCEVTLALSNLALKVGEMDGMPAIYPIFDFRVCSSIVLSISDDDMDRPTMTPEQRAAFHDSIILRGKTGVSKKRKQPKETKKLGLAKKTKRAANEDNQQQLIEALEEEDDELDEDEENDVESE